MELSMELMPGRHLYEQIYEHIREEIRSGKLLAGEKLPSTRHLAATLRISRTTAELAYEQLEEEGYLVIRQGSGAYVCETQNLLDRTEKERENGQEKGRLSQPQEEKTAEPAPHPKEEMIIDFSPRTIDMSAFPYATWRRILRGILTGDRADLFHRGDPQGDLELRTTIARYLHLSRGCKCGPEQIVIGAGNDYLLMLLGILLGSGLRQDRDTTSAPDQIPERAGKENHVLRIGMESPTYLRAADVMRSVGFSVEPVQSDGSGMRADALEESGSSLAYVMPARQFPTGVVMPYPRRTELLAWAGAGKDRYLLEDDYDSEFKYRGRPVPSLQSMDETGSVIYLGTFSKSIAPAIRVSYLILPEKLLPVFHEKAGFFSCTVPRLDQAILNEFIQEGYFERYLNRMRNRYRAKHDLMLEVLKPLEKKFEIRGQGAGLHLILKKKEEWEKSEQSLTEAAAKEGVLVYPMSEQKLPESGPEDSGTPAILLGYAALTEKEIRDGADKLIRAWGQ